MPQPLTLGQAIDLAAEHPVLALARSDVDLAQAQLDQVTADSGIKLSALAELSAVEPSDRSLDDSNNDSKAFLRAQKRLYDFGYSELRESAAALALSSKQSSYLDQHQQHLLDVTEQFYKVLVADKDYVLFDEEMTLAFLDYDKARDRNELGQVSDIHLLELENDYREKLQLRKIAEQQQRLSRQQLAVLLNMPGQLPADLVEPEVSWDKSLPEFETAMEKAAQNNPRLIAAREAVAAARERLSAAQASDNPVVSGLLQLAKYERETSSTHPATASLIMAIPLYSGGATEAEIAAARAGLDAAQAELAQTELAIRQAVLATVLELDSLKADLQALQISADYSELYLDQNRALYELEVSSDFGDAVVRVSRVIRDRLRSQLAFALAEARLAALQGAVLDTAATAEQPPSNLSQGTSP